MRVFKYRGGDWTKVKRDLRSLARNEIYAAPFTSLNDPFESKFAINQQSFDLGNLLLNRLSGSADTGRGDLAMQFNAAVDRFVEFTKDMGIYSLSKNPIDELLWAHYANSHQGFCLEFDLEQLLDYKIIGEETLNVSYQDAPPLVSMHEFMLLSDAKKDLLQKLIATKSKCWCYEKEIRICVGRFGLREYDFRALKGIYFGLRCPPRVVRLAMRLLRGRGLNYYKMALTTESYKLQFLPIADMWPSALPYRGTLATIGEGVPHLDDKTKPYEREIRAAIEIARREPYCENITDVYLSGTKGTQENPVFYVAYDRSDGLPRNFFYSVKEVRNHAFYTGEAGALRPPSA